MATRPLTVKSRPPLLLSRTQTAEKEALSYLSSVFEENFSSLTEAQRRRYPRLFKASRLAVQAVDDDLVLFKETFKNIHLAALKSELKALLGVDIDPEQAWIRTRYREDVQVDFVEYLTRISGSYEAAGDAKYSFSPARTRRALDESRYKEHISSISLWDAACENFSYRTDSVLLKPYSYEQASYIDYNSDLRGQPTGPFIAIVRKLDLGARLQAMLNEAIGTNGPLTQQAITAARACFEFELLEALRTSITSKVLRDEHEQLLAMLKGRSAPRIWPVSMSLSKKIGLLDTPIETGENGRLLFGQKSQFEFVGTGEVPVPLFIIKLEQVAGVYSYFPQRKGGALLWHRDVKHALVQFKQQLQQGHSRGELGWFIRQLALKDVGFFSKLLADEPRPRGMTWLAGVLYDGFHRVFPEPDLDSLHFYVEISPRRPLPVAKLIAQRQLQRFQSNLSLLATRKSELDWQAFKEALTDLGSEVLSLLTTPVPGGVLGLNAIMQVAVFGSLAYSILQGVNEAIKGDANTFASALADTADMMISARLIGVAAKVHRQRMHAVWNTLGQPRKHLRADGSAALWSPDLMAYPHLDASALDRLTPTAEGLYEIDGKRYAKVQEGDQTLAVEVIYDSQAGQYVLKTSDRQTFRPPVRFDSERQVWEFEADHVHALDNAQWVQRMLPVDMSEDSPLEGITRILDVTGTTREQLQAVWQSELIGGRLAEGVRRFQADQLIERIISDLPLRAEMPLNADSAVLAVLTQLPNWPVDTVLDVYNPQRQLIETYGKDVRPGMPLTRIELKRLDHGEYVARHDVTQGSAQAEQLFSLILDQLPQTSTLGLAENPDISKAGRIALLREQIASAVNEHRPLLFRALTALEGHTRSDPVASSDPAKHFLPLLCAPVSDSTTPLLAKLHELNPSLSVECLEPLLLSHPFSPREVTRALEHNSQPLPFAHAADQLKIKLRVDLALDAIYHRRVFSFDADNWVREVARGILRDTLDRRLIVSELSRPTDADAYVPSGAGDSTVLLSHHGQGTYEVTDLRSGVRTLFSSASDSFYLALSQVLSPAERQALGSVDASIAGLRQALGDALLAHRQADGQVNLWSASAGQFERKVSLPEDSPGELGLYEIQGKKYLSLYGAVYQVEYDLAIHKWRFVHPYLPGVNTPILEHNHDGAWRQKNENPQLWPKLKLLRRLRAEPTTFSDEVGHQIMAVSNTSEGVLLQVHINNLTPPPLLIDTWKRFRIEESIQVFVKNMQAHHTLTRARTDFQLLLLQSLPGWPNNNVLQVVDAQGNTLKEYGTDLGSSMTRIRVVVSEMDNGRLLRTLLLSLNEAQTRTLLGKYDPIIESRVLILAKKIAAHALKREANLFKSIYENQEHSADPHVTLVQGRYPDLPKSIIEHLLKYTSALERSQFLDKSLIPPRLSEQITWTDRDVRLTRAYEGLYLSGTATPDSERLTLHMLQSLPGWPAQVRIEVRRNEPGGELMDSIGASGPSSARILVKRDERYQAYSPEGQPINGVSVTDNNLLSSILHVLHPAEQAAIGIKETGDTQTLGAKIAEQAQQHRANAQKLLGLEPPLPPRKPPMNVDASFFAYPVTVNYGDSSYSLALVRQVRLLYPGLNYEGAVRFLDGLGGTEATQLGTLAQQRLQFENMQAQLNAWEQIQLYPTGTSHVGMAAPGHRRQVCERIVQAWRRETVAAQAADGSVIGPILDLHGWDVGDLPPITADFSHIRVLRMDAMNIRTGSNEFLSRFNQLHTLNMSNNRLSRVPSAIANMPHLRSIELSNNHIALTTETAQHLTHRPLLESLYLDHNSLGVTLDVSQMSALRHLSLERTGLHAWPQGLWALTMIEWANLRHNEITTVPQAVFDVPDPATTNRAVNIAGNPVADESRDRIITYWVRTGINLGYMPAVAHAIDLAQAQRVAKDISPWLSVHLNEVERQQRVQQWALLNGFGDKADRFFHMLGFFVQDQAKMTHQSWDVLIRRVWVLIDQMLADTVLRDLLFEGVVYERRTCGDGAMMILENLEVQVLIHQAQSRTGEGQMEAQMFKLAKQLFRLRKVDEMADTAVRKRMEGGGLPDVAEVQLLFRVGLVESLELPTQSRTMLYAPIVADFTPQVLEARDHILAMDGGPAFMHAIMHESFWRDFLKNRYAERFAAIEDEFQSDYLKLSAEQGLADDVELQRGQALVLSRDQKIEQLIEDLTRQAYQTSQTSAASEPAL